jgi:hypothetical protein
MTASHAIRLLEQLKDADEIIRECEHVQNSTRTPIDSLRIRLGENECWAHPADLKAIAERARDSIICDLKEGGYVVPAVRR